MGPYFNPGAQGGGKLHAQGGRKLATKTHFPAQTVDQLWPKTFFRNI